MEFGTMHMCSPVDIASLMASKLYMARGHFCGVELIEIIQELVSTTMSASKDLEGTSKCWLHFIGPIMIHNHDFRSRWEIIDENVLSILAAFHQLNVGLSCISNTREDGITHFYVMGN